ncbi:hypothetical protein [Tenacibaculum sediminilitoris]
MKIANGKTELVIYAIEEKTKNVIDFIINSRNTENLKSVFDKVLL